MAFFIKLSKYYSERDGGGKKFSSPTTDWSHFCLPHAISPVFNNLLLLNRMSVKADFSLSYRRPQAHWHLKRTRDSSQLRQDFYEDKLRWKRKRYLLQPLAHSWRRFLKYKLAPSSSRSFTNVILPVLMVETIFISQVVEASWGSAGALPGRRIRHAVSWVRKSARYISPTDSLSDFAGMIAKYIYSLI